MRIQNYEIRRDDPLNFVVIHHETDVAKRDFKDGGGNITTPKGTQYERERFIGYYPNLERSILAVFGLLAEGGILDGDVGEAAVVLDAIRKARQEVLKALETQTKPE